MDISAGYSINEPDVVAEDFNGQVVILNLANGHYFSLEGIAAPIWSLLLSNCPPEVVLESIGQSRPDLVEDSAQFIERLVALDLIVPNGRGPAAASGIDASWAGGSPQIQIFDDLAELIFADPIHDVDEQAGWPTPRQTP
ncbi:MAG: PqqD family peptide modification chaperone [Blastocatellia bacterium]